jgi:transaldolase/glucose-6-phosphate isomerase
LRAGWALTLSPEEGAMARHNVLRNLEHEGTSIWLDYIHRDLLRSGELAHMVKEDCVRGLTANPTIFQRAITEGTSYDDQIEALAREGQHAREILRAIAADDIHSAANVLGPVHGELARGDGYACIHAWPDAANDTEAIVDDACRLWTMIGRPNVMITVPATAAGLPAIERLIGQGVNVAVTLLFDVNTYAQVAEAYMAGLERRRAAWQSIERVASVAMFFLSRVDSAVDGLLEEKISAAGDEAERERLRALQGKAAIANAKRAYEHYRQLLWQPRWELLAAAGAAPQRLLWASISPKNPAHRDVKYVEALIGGNLVVTLPQPILDAFKDHGVVRSTIGADLEDAHRTLAELEAVGIDLEAVARRLQNDGVAQFKQSVDTAMERIEEKRTGMLARAQ